MRVVLDTNVLVAALRSDMGASYAIAAQLPSKRFQMALTVPLYLQYQDVSLTRPEHMTSASTRDDILNFLRYLCSIAHQQRVFFLWRPWLKDPQDDMVLEAAVGPKVATSLRTISATLPGARLKSISVLCLYVLASFYTASGVESYEYDHCPITEVLACQN